MLGQVWGTAQGALYARHQLKADHSHTYCRRQSIATSSSSPNRPKGVASTPGQWCSSLQLAIGLSSAACAVRVAFLLPFMRIARMRAAAATRTADTAGRRWPTDMPAPHRRRGHRLPSPTGTGMDLEPEGIRRSLGLTAVPVGNSIVVSFYNKVARDWEKEGGCIQMRLPDPHSAVIITSQQQLDRPKDNWHCTKDDGGRVEVELEEAEVWLALCVLDIECYASSYKPSYIAQALTRLMIQPKMKQEMKQMMREMLGRMR